MTKYAAKGVQLQIGDGATAEAFTKVVQLSNVGGIELLQETEDVTDHDSPSWFREHVETVGAVGDVPFEGHWDPEAATHISLLALAGASSGPHNCKIIWVPGTTTAAFAASVTMKVGDAAVDGKLPVSGTLKISGPVAWT